MHLNKSPQELDKYKICMVKGLPQMILNELKIMIEISEGFGGRGAKFLMNMVSWSRVCPAGILFL